MIRIVLRRLAARASPRIRSLGWALRAHVDEFKQIFLTPLYGVFIVKRFESGDLSFSLYRSVSLFDLESRFFAPTRSIARPARAGAVKVGRRSNLASYCALARPHLDSFEHDGTVGAVGMTIRGEPAFRARINRATTLYPVGPGPEP